MTGLSHNPSNDWPVRLGQCAVIGACLYPLALCGIHTNVMRVSVATIGLTEALLIGVCLPIMLRRIQPWLLLLVLFVLASQAALWLLRGAIDLKAVRDFLIPTCFLWVGINVSDRQLADRTLYIVSAITLTIGLFEWLFLDVYTRIFNILSYYVSTVGSSVAAGNPIPGQMLNINGVRPEGIGRTLLPWLLGSHRISSVFIEPVSLGNFAAILAAWGLARGEEERSTMWRFMLLACIFTVMADSRFGLVTIGLLVIFRMTLNAVWSRMAMLFPLLAMLIMLGLYHGFPGYVGDNFLGRLVYSGSLLANSDLPILFGIDGWYLRYGDAGYNYLLSRFGLPSVLLMWCAYWWLGMGDQSAERLRAYAALYIALILAVSGSSLFAMKTSALLWFLVGTGAKTYTQSKHLGGRRRTSATLFPSVRAQAIPIH